MCGIVGFTTFRKKTDKDKEILFNMTKTLTQRGPDEEDYYFSNNIAMRS